MLDIESLAIDPELARGGVWTDYMGARFLLARPGEAYQARLVSLYNEHIDLIKKATPEGNQKAADIFKQTYAETVLLDWADVGTKDEKGVLIPIKYTPEIGFKVLSDPRQFEFAGFIERFVNNRTNYQQHVEQQVATDVKSSAAS